MSDGKRSVHQGRVSTSIEESDSDSDSDNEEIPQSQLSKRVITSCPLDFKNCLCFFLYKTDLLICLESIKFLEKENANDSQPFGCK